MSMEMSKKKPRHKKADRAVLLLVSLVLVLSAAIGGTLGYLTGQVSVTNTMQVGEFTTKIDENTENGIKSDVKVQNTGDYDAYIRAVVVVTWQNENGEVYPVAPVANKDYIIEYGNQNQWSVHGGFYYYNGVVGAEQSTGNLINRCEPVGGKAPKGYDLNVEILASAIQAEPAQAVKDAWGMQYQDNGGWTSVSGN